MQIDVIGSGLQARIATLCCAHAGAGNVSFSDTGGTEASPVVEIPPNAMRVLSALGLRPRLAAIAHMPMAELYRATGSGALLAYRPLGPFVEQRYGAPHLHCSTAALTNLFDTAMTDAGVMRRHAATAGMSNADVIIQAGSSHDADLHDVIGTDAVPSGASWEISVHWSEQTDGPLLNWLDGGCYARQIPVNEGTCTLVMRDASSASARTERRLQLPATLDWRPLTEQRYQPNWHHEQFVLIGDLAHPLLPFAGQAFALAAEDAWVLARMLALYDDHLPTAFGEYERFRQPRASRMQSHLKMLAQQHAERNPLRRLTRNLGMGMRHRLLPELAMQRDDWQFEYDCIKGFD